VACVFREIGNEPKSRELERGCCGSANEAIETFILGFDRATERIIGSLGA
jgi:hypothetical protein